MGQFRKLLYGQPYRGFESPSLLEAQLMFKSIPLPFPLINPSSATKEMTAYRRTHKKCEFGYCIWSETKTLHVHHILPKFKYPESINGNYNGRIGNNFISYCPFHHLAYHYSYAHKRKDKKHENALGMLNRNMEEWALKNKISFEDLDLELTQMLR